MLCSYTFSQLWSINICYGCHTYNPNCFPIVITFHKRVSAVDNDYSLTINYRRWARYVGVT